MESPIAIVGIGLRLPGGCHDTESFWDLLVNKKDGRKEVPTDRFNIDGFHNSQPADSAGNLSVKYGYFLDEPVDRFDAGFFSMSQAEVVRLDPQQRLLLEVVYEAMESAGETEPEGRNVGVYAASFASDWAHMQARDARDEHVYGLTGRDDWVHANRVSYEFNFFGPSMTVKTACSSSLVALHLACEAVQRGDCTGAIVCVSNLILSPDTSLALDHMGVLSKDGSSKSFDASADGYARGEAVEAIYIKRLDDARRDGNPVRAVIRGTSTNSDGKTRGLFTPSPDAHAALIRRAYAKAGIPPTDTPFVECHGTGTATGDPLELAAIASTFGGGENATYIGSVKPNIGHGEAAAGLSSLIKAVLALERNTIPPNIKFNTPNPKIPFAESNLNVPTKAMPWPSNRAKRVSVNSFGMGGANAHAVIEAAPLIVKQNGYYKQNGFHPPRTNGFHHPLQNGVAHSSNGVLPASSVEPTRSEQKLLVFSSHSETTLQKMLSNYKEFIQRGSFRLSDLAYTLSTKRLAQTVRSFCVTDGQTFQTTPGSRISRFRGLLFIFTGQGAQWAGMGRELIQDFPTFGEDIRKMDLWLAECDYPPQWKIEGLLRSSADINAAEFAQPICTALQLALVNLLRRWDVLPAAVVGHSSGEIAAAYAADALGMKEALLVSYYRGVATSELRQQGAMGAIGLGRHDLDGLLAGNAVIACENSGSSVTISGSVLDVEESLDRISRMRPGVLARKLKIDRAYHSGYMRAVSERYENLMSSIKPKQGKLDIPLFSSVTGQRTLDASSLGPPYWRTNMERPVLFLSAVESAFLAKDQWSTALEIGPHSTLSGPFRQICQAMGEKVNYTNTLTRGDDCTKSVLTTLGNLFCQGLVPRLSEVNPPGVTLTNLPPYPWNHDTSYWHESRNSHQFRTREFPEHELLGVRVIGGLDLEPSWRKLLDVNKVSWLRDHVVAGDVVFPGAGYIATVGEAIRQLSKSSSYTIHNCSIGAAMILRDGEKTEIITKLRTRENRGKTQASGWYDFTVSSFDGTKWHHHVNGEVHTEQNSGSNMIAPKVKTIRQLEGADWYRTSRAAGLDFGPSFQLLQSIRCAVGDPVASADVFNETLPKGSSYAIHPTVIDSLLQCCIIAPFKGHLRKMNKLVLPIHINELHVQPQGIPTDLHLRGAITSHKASSISANGQIQTSNGSVILQFENVQFRTLDNNAVDSNDDKHVQHLLEWKPDIDLVDNNKLLHRTVDRTSCIKLVEELSIFCIIESAILLKNIETPVPHLRRFKQWLDEFVSNIQQNGSKVVENTDYIFKLTSEERQPHIRRLLEEALETPAKDVAIAVTRMYNAAEDIFRGNIEALAVLLPNDVLTNIYNFLNTIDHKEFLQLLGHSKPNMRILEIGAGTGGFTSTILPALRNSGVGHMYGTYTYTDISSGFFKAAKERFQEYPNIEFAVLDISQDLQSQGIEEHSYDLLVASNVLHATPNLQKTLSNCRSLLRPGGRLLLLEYFPDAKFANYIYGFLSGWWAGEHDGRANEPYIEPVKWDVALRNAGFDGIEASITDQESPCHLDAMMISRASEPQYVSSKRLSLLLPEDSLASERTNGFQCSLELAGYDVSLCTLSNLPSASTDIISLLESDESRPFFKDIPEVRFNSLISLIEKCYSRGNKILWITGSAQMSAPNPYHGMILGLARTLRLELGSVFATVELETNELGPSQCGSILKVFRKLQSKSSLSYDTVDYEFALAKGDINIPRYITNSTNDLLGKTVDSMQSAKRLFIKNPGQLQTLQWGLELRAPSMLDGEIEIEVKTASLNSWDYDVARGGLQSPTNLGLECAGLVSRIGTNSKHNLQIGDRVLCWSPGSLSTHVQVDARFCVKLPDSIPLDEAVSLSTSYAAMIRGLVELCDLAQGDSVLISSAAGPDVTAAIQIARLAGAEIFVTAATEEQKVLLETKHGIPQSHIFSSNDDSFVRSIMESTNGQGVDIIVNFSSDGQAYNRWRCSAEGGSVLELSQRDSSVHEKLDCSSLLGGNRSFYAYDMVNLLQQKPSMAHRLLETVLKLYNAGSIKPISPISKFPPTEIREAFQHLHVNRHTGATCIEFPSDPTKLTADFFAEQSSFRADGAYLLVGGLGGLGKSAAMWLAERGAGHIIFLSRSATEHATTNVNFLQELRALGCSVQVVAGNVADAATVERIVADSPKPIVGVVHLPVVVRDRPLLEMSHADWEVGVLPKVLGAWNLHNALEKHTLDFFILLGSANGVRGNHGQANYAAANTFLDAFVQYRQHRHLPASIMDLGPVEDIGFLVDNDYVDGFRRVGARMVDENEYLDAFELAVRSCHLPREEPTSPSEGFVNRAQFVTGSIQRPYDVRAQVFARIGNGIQNDHAAIGQNTTEGKQENKMQQFMEQARANPQSFAAEDAETPEAFLAAQILEAAKTLLIFDDDDDEDSGLDMSADLAIDSLVAIELQSWWRQSMGTQVSVLELTKNTSPLELGKLARKMILADLKVEG